MKNKVLKTLEFYKIINMLLDCSQSIIGKKLIKNAEISTDIIKIKKLLDETDEAYRFIMKHKTPAISNIDDLEEDFKLLEVGRFFTIRKLLEVWKLLNTSRFLKNLISIFNYIYKTRCRPYPYFIIFFFIRKFKSLSLTRNSIYIKI